MAARPEAELPAAGAYGHFDAEQREYVITEPLTPLPWINYLGGKALHSIISNTGGGYSFYRDAKLRRLTRYRYDSVPLDGVGKYLYIADGDATWNPGFRPTRTPLDRYECRHGLGYTRFRSARNGLAADLLVFVADDDVAELQVLTLRNESSAAKALRIFSYVEWCLWNAEDDAANLQRNLSLAECLVNGSMVCHITGYRERRAHYGFHLVNHPVDGFDTDRSAFLGPYGDVADPAVVRARRPGNSQVSGWWPIASLSLPLTLRPGESKELVFATGFAENLPDEKWASDGSPNVAAARRLRARLQDSAHVERAFSEHRRRWDSLLDALQVKHAGPAAERARQHLESVPVHGDVPARAQRVAVRDRPRPRHRLPRFEPGLPRRRPHGPGRGSRAPDSPRRHAEERRQRLSPVPAADADRQRRDRRRIQRRPAVARAERRGLRARDRAARTCSTPPFRSRTRRMAAPRCATTSRRPCATRWSGSARTSCR